MSKAYIKPHGTDEWKELGVANVDIQLADDEAHVLRWNPEAIRSTLSDSWTVTWSRKMDRFEERMWRRMFGLPNPPLIHNGKKPRR